MSTLTLAQVEVALKKRIKKLKGSDTDGKDFTSIIPLWNHIFPTLNDEQKSKKARLATEAISSVDWYGNASKYWEDEANCPITDGKSTKSVHSMLNSLIIATFLCL